MPDMAVNKTDLFLWGLHTAGVGEAEIKQINIWKYQVVTSTTEKKWNRKWESCEGGTVF